MSHRIGSVIGKIGGAYKEEANRLEKDSRDKLGTLVWMSKVRALAGEANLDLVTFMFNPHEDVPDRLIAAVALVENNLDFMEPKEDEHTQRAISLFNQMLRFWMSMLDTMVYSQRQLLIVTDVTERAELENYLTTMTLAAERFIVRAKTLVNNKAHSKSDHIPNTLAVGTIGPNPAAGLFEQGRGTDDTVVDVIREAYNQSKSDETE